MLHVAIRVAVGLIFLTAAVGKLRNWTALQGVVANYRLLPEAWVLPVSGALPILESVVAAALLLPLAVTPFAAPFPELVAALLLAAFALAMAINLLRGRRNIDCGCFQSGLKQTLRWSLVARNAALIAALVLGAADRSPPDAWTTVNAAIAGVALFVAIQAWNTLWSIVPAPLTRAALQRHAGDSV